jgi:hypothetical protein
MDNLLTQTETVLNSSLSASEALTAMAVSLIFGLIISATYMLTHKDGYQRSFVITLTMLPIILAVIILFVGSNIARAFSLAGTLSIIRFRSAPGDPEDIGYIFFDIAAGLACGVGLYVYGTVFVILLCLFMIIITKLNFGSEKNSAKILKILIPEDLNYEGAFDEIFNKYTSSNRLVKVKTTELGSIYEVVYNIKIAKNADEKAFLDEIRCRNGNLSIMLSLAADEIYGGK